MDEIKWVLKASPSDVLEMRAKAAAGDGAAARLYVLHSFWRRLSAQPKFSTRAKIKALRTLADSVTVRWQTQTAA